MKTHFSSHHDAFIHFAELHSETSKFQKLVFGERIDENKVLSFSLDELDDMYNQCKKMYPDLLYGIYVDLPTQHVMHFEEHLYETVLTLTTAQKHLCNCIKANPYLHCYIRKIK